MVDWMRLFSLILSVFDQKKKLPTILSYFIILIVGSIVVFIEAGNELGKYNIFWCMSFMKRLRDVLHFITKVIIIYHFSLHLSRYCNLQYMYL